nr:penicillin-binding protein [Treponema sp.]
AWTCGITPYYAAAFWFGFDKPGQSLGLNITGATLAGFAWGEYFDKVHADLPYKEWNKPLEGVIQVTVCSESGQLPTEACGDHTTTQWYLEGTQPTEICPIHSTSSSSSLAINRLEKEMIMSGQRWTQQVDFTPLTINWDMASADYVPEETTDTSEEGFEDSDSEMSDMEENKVYDYNYLME